MLTVDPPVVTFSPTRLGIFPSNEVCEASLLFFFLFFWQSLLQLWLQLFQLKTLSSAVGLRVDDSYYASRMNNKLNLGAVRGGLVQCTRIRTQVQTGDNKLLRSRERQQLLLCLTCAHFVLHPCCCNIVSLGCRQYGICIPCISVYSILLRLLLYIKYCL